MLLKPALHPFLAVQASFTLTFKMYRMKTIIMGILFLIIRNSICNAQIAGDLKPGQLVEGAKVVVDILKLLRKNEKIDYESGISKTKVFCNYCIYNSDSIKAIRVTLISKLPGQGDTLQLVIKKLGKECSLQIPCGVYNCKIQSLDNVTISWGDVFIDAKTFQHQL